ncbi:Potassium channel subfamily K member 5 [Willisornis vidua]|uniref:Potassium channel subfamily K member 5 n=1 Tax=Willisornis vidua TaxID=1566151 RepID=A0ABQ9CUW1_9PASS|nr:Potassium channel subfamily K member 5 [Willisornis vidua]
MVDRGPLLTSAIIFYLSIGAAIFEVLEEPHWRSATDDYKRQKTELLKQFPCLGQEGLDKILQVLLTHILHLLPQPPSHSTPCIVGIELCVESLLGPRSDLNQIERKEEGRGKEELVIVTSIVSDAAGQGVAITGNNTFNNWNWPNAVIFAATVITTIGYGNVSPKTPSGRLFCIFYGLFGVPLCLTWISALGKFFGGRAKRLGQFLTKRGVSLRKAQITCTAIFIVWGVLVHLVIPPFVFMVTEGWNYIEGLYFSFITITTIGFGDFVAGVNPDANYHALYRYFVELWIYLGLAWLSLFVNWKVSMFVEVHKAIKKRRKKRKESFDNHPRSKKPLQMGTSKDVNIFSFLSKKEETYNDLIKQIGKKALKTSNDKMIIVENAKQMNASIDVQVTYTKTESFEYDEASLDIQNGHVLRSLHDKRIGDSPLEGTMFVNQLDRISEEEGEVWDSRDYRPLIFENANITFVNEDDDEEEDISDDEETSKSSMDDNLVEESETAKKLVKFPSSDESTFTNNELELSVPYEQLMNEYNTVSNVKAAT